MHGTRRFIEYTMNLLFCVRECVCRALARKKTLIIFAAVFLLGMIIGLCCIQTPAIYVYHLKICDRFIDRICYSDRSVFLIFLERTGGNLLLLFLFLAAGMHFAALALPPALILYRAYTFGGSLYIFCSVYGASGVLIAFVLFFPIHVAIDLIYLCATTLSCCRAPQFRFGKGEFRELLLDFLVLSLLILLVCLVEAILLAALFHPLGNLL